MVPQRGCGTRFGDHRVRARASPGREAGSRPDQTWRRSRAQPGPRLRTRGADGGPGRQLPYPHRDDRRDASPSSVISAIQIISLDPEASSYNLAEPMASGRSRNHRNGLEKLRGKEPASLPRVRLSGRTSVALISQMVELELSPRGDRRPPLVVPRREPTLEPGASSIAQRRRLRRRSARFERRATTRSCPGASVSAPSRSLRHRNFGDRYRTTSPRGHHALPRWLCWRARKGRESQRELRLTDRARSSPCWSVAYLFVGTSSVDPHCSVRGCNGWRLAACPAVTTPLPVSSLRA